MSNSQEIMKTKILWKMSICGISRGLFIVSHFHTYDSHTKGEPWNSLIMAVSPIY